MKEQLGRFEVSRSISGAEAFLTSADMIGRRVIGAHNTGHFVTLPSSEYDGDEVPSDDLRILTQNIAEVTSRADLKVVLLDRRSPHDIQYGFSRVFGSFVGRTPGAVSGRQSKGSQATPASLATVMSRIGLKYDIMSQEEVPIVCDGIVVVPDVELDGQIQYGLSLDATESSTAMLADQATACIERLADLRGGKKIAFPFSAPPLSIPFVRVPTSVDIGVRAEYIAQLKKSLPLRLLMGVVETKINT